eukprot:9482841-Pyramimonas_sp.AAC.2
MWRHGGPSLQYIQGVACVKQKNGEDESESERERERERASAIPPVHVLTSRIASYWRVKSKNIVAMCPQSHEGARRSDRSSVASAGLRRRCSGCTSPPVGARPSTARRSRWSDCAHACSRRTSRRSRCAVRPGRGPRYRVPGCPTPRES